MSESRFLPEVLKDNKALPQLPRRVSPHLTDAYEPGDTLIANPETTSYEIIMNVLLRRNVLGGDKTTSVVHVELDGLPHSQIPKIPNAIFYLRGSRISDKEKQRILESEQLNTNEQIQPRRS